MKFDEKCMNFMNMNFTFNEFAVNMNNNFMKQLWIWVWKLWISHEYEFKTHEWVHIWTKIAWIWIWILMPIHETWRIIPIAIHESLGLYEPKQFFFLKKNRITTVKEIKKVSENLKMPRKKRKMHWRNQICPGKLSFFSLQFGIFGRS